MSSNLVSEVVQFGNLFLKLLNKFEDPEVHLSIVKEILSLQSGLNNFIIRTCNKISSLKSSDFTQESKLEDNLETTSKPEQTTTNGSSTIPNHNVVHGLKTSEGLTRKERCGIPE